MGERLAVIRSEPARVLDWWARTGASRDVLAGAYPKSQIVSVEPGAAEMPAPWWSSRRWRQPAVVAEDAVAPGAAQLVWANMMLHGQGVPQAAMARWHAALAVDGFLMFSTFGPGTLETLTALYRQAGWPPPLAPLVDMHDLGDMLVQAGFADPVMDQELLTLTWPSAEAAVAELRALGGNAAPQRHAGLRTPRWRRRLLDLIAATAGADGRPALTFEIVYGHAFKPAPKWRVQAETTVAMEDLRAAARAGRTRP